MKRFAIIALTLLVASCGPSRDMKQRIGDGDRTLVVCDSAGNRYVIRHETFDNYSVRAAGECRTGAEP